MDIGKGKLCKGNFTLIVCSLLFVYLRKETYHNFLFLCCRKQYQHSIASYGISFMPSILYFLSSNQSWYVLDC